MMKRLLFSLALLSAVCQASMAQSVSSIFRDFKNVESVDYISISPMMMKLGRMFIDDGQDAEMAKKVKSVRIMDFEDSPASVKKQFRKKVARLDLSDYEVMVKVRENGETVRVLVRSKDDIVTEIVMICSGKETCTLVQIGCKIGREDLAGLVEEYSY